MVHFKILFTKSISNIPYPPQASDVLQILHWASVIQDPREPRRKKSNLLGRPRRGANLETIKLSGCRFTALGCHDRSFRIPANLGSNRTYYGGRGVVCGYQAR